MNGMIYDDDDDNDADDDERHESVCVLTKDSVVSSRCGLRLHGIFVNIAQAIQCLCGCLCIGELLGHGEQDSSSVDLIPFDRVRVQVDAFFSEIVYQFIWSLIQAHGALVVMIGQWRIAVPQDLPTIQEIFQHVLRYLCGSVSFHKLTVVLRLSLKHGAVQIASGVDGLGVSAHAIEEQGQFGLRRLEVREGR